MSHIIRQSFLVFLVALATVVIILNSLVLLDAINRNLDTPSPSPIAVVINLVMLGVNIAIALNLVRLSVNTVLYIVDKGD